MAKLDSSGNYLWVTRAGGSSDDIGQSVTMLSDGSSLVTGQFQGSIDFGNTTLVSEGSSPRLMKMEVFYGPQKRVAPSRLPQKDCLE